MVVNSLRPLLRPAGGLWLALVPVAIYIALVSWLDLRFHFEEYNLPMTLVAVPGTVIGLLLAFKTNSCYGRWWEARTIWGAIVNDSRTWIRQLIEFCEVDGEAEENVAVRRMAFRQIAWCYALTRSLRKQDPLVDAREFLGGEEIEELKAQNNVPNAILLKQAVELGRLHRENKFDSYRFVEMENTLRRLTDAMGGCERIKNTPFPASYRHLVTGLIYLFILFLPYGLADMPALGLFSTSLLLALSFLVINRVAIHLQDPFENWPSDTPMLSLSRIIEINVKQMLGESELPEELVPVGGVLY